MTATNHVLTGSLIGLSIHQPLALALAFGSHFVLDALPHYGNSHHTSRRFLTILFSDMFCGGLVFITMAITQPEYWQFGIVCGFVAASPDLMWFSNWLREMTGRPKKPYTNPIELFHGRIQWAEKARNWPMEPLWATLMVTLLVKTL